MRDILKGRRVLDFTQIGAGPTCAMLLGDFGADVIKIEPPGGDLGRGLGPPWYAGQSPIHIAFNRGKRSICLDLRSVDGMSIAHEMARRCDVVVESFRPGVMARLGLGFDEVKALNPRVVYCSVSGFGQTGPKASQAGVDGILQAASGLMGLIGIEGLEPCKVQAPVVDVFTGYVGALGVLARLLERDKTGVGGMVDVSLLASAVALQQSAVTSYMGERIEPARLGSAAPYSAPNEAFRTSDGWIMVAAYMEPRWKRLCALLLRPDLEDDPRFRTSGDRVRNRPALRELLNEAFGRNTSAYWLSLLQAEDILCSKVAGYADLVEDSQVKHLNLLVSLEHEALGSFSTPGSAINARQTNASSYTAPPQLGQHTLEILRDLGYSESAAALLIERGAAAIPRPS